MVTEPTLGRGADLVGQTLAGEYYVVSLLGEGGFGQVLRARRIGAGGFAKDVALKMLHAKMDHTPDVVNRLKDEARFLGLLSHPAIVKVDLLTRIHDRWTVVMELVEGVDLRVLLRAHGPLPPAVVMRIGAEVAGALDYAYNHPVTQPDGVRQPLHLLHRDIKPLNLQLTPHGEVKVLDFGIAKAELVSREAVTGTNIYMSAEYAAPERLRRVEHPAGDVFSLGAVLVELLTGQPLNLVGPLLEAMLRGERVNTHTYVRDRLAKLDAQLARVHGLPPSTRALIMQTIQWDHNVRPTARTLAKELRTQEAASGYDFLAFCDRAIGPLTRGEALTPQAVAIGVSAPIDASLGVALQGQRPRPTLRRDALIIVGGGLAGLAVGGLALMLGLTLWPSGSLPAEGTMPNDPVGDPAGEGLTSSPEQQDGAGDAVDDAQMPVGTSAATADATSGSSKPTTEEGDLRDGSTATTQPPPEEPQPPPKPTPNDTQGTKKPQTPTTAEIRVEGSLTKVWLLGANDKSIGLTSTNKTVTPGTYQVLGKVGDGNPEPLGISVTLAAGEQVTLNCKAMSAKCSIVRGKSGQEAQ